MSIFCPCLIFVQLLSKINSRSWFQIFSWKYPYWTWTKLGQILDKIWTKLGHLSKNCLNFVRTDIVQEQRKGYPIFDEHSIPPFQGACTGMAIAQNHANTIGTGLGRICSLIKCGNCQKSYQNLTVQGNLSLCMYFA